jgi:transposase
MNGKTLLPDPSLIKLERFISSPEAITIVVKTKPSQAFCSLCQQPSHKVHSRYVRRLADLPWQGVAIRLELTVRRFFCINDECPRKIFAEQLPSIVKRYARKTLRLNDALTLIGFVIGGEAGARVAKRLSMSTSPDTLLRRLRQAVLVERSTPKVLGVDDWAFRKGQRYGTILIDLEKHCPIDLLKDREAETLRAWLVAHPGVEIISRDRANAYAEAARKGAPDAVQIADRFHLLKNLAEAFENFLKRHHKDFREAAERLSPTPIPRPEGSKPIKPTRSELEYERRNQRYEKARELRLQGGTIAGIARQLGISRRTVRLFLHSDSCPKRAIPVRRKRSLDNYQAYLKQRWNEGCHNMAELYREVCTQGFTGGQRTMTDYLSSWREHLPPLMRRKRHAAIADYPIPVHPPSTRKTTWLLLKKEKDSTEFEQSFLSKLKEICPEIKIVEDLAFEFIRLVKNRQAKELDDWLEKACKSKVAEMKSFANGIKKDKAPVVAALEYEWSNGQVEGQVNRLKTIKRQMYGRGKLDLLRARVLYSL